MDLKFTNVFKFTNIFKLVLGVDCRVVDNIWRLVLENRIRIPYPPYGWLDLLSLGGVVG